jgi:hypothetical protein
LREEIEEFGVRRGVVVEPARPLGHWQLRRRAERPVEDQLLPRDDVADDLRERVSPRAARLLVQPFLRHRLDYLPVAPREMVKHRLRVFDDRLHHDLQ